VYTLTKLHDIRIPNVGVGVRVGVGPMEFQLFSSSQRLAACAVTTGRDVLLFHTLETFISLRKTRLASFVIFPLGGVTSIVMFVSLCPLA